jgi:hypothetical protein
MPYRVAAGWDLATSVPTRATLEDAGLGRGRHRFVGMWRKA